MSNNNFLVRVGCLTYNHAPYITETMNGFCMQETNFPFVCTIIDDASTDGEPGVIKKYLENNFNLNDASITRNEETDDYSLIYARHKTNQNCFFAVVLLKYNHYKKKRKGPYISEWSKNVKYTALCEGDDYWTDPLKLQKQVDFLEKHPDYTMVCNRVKLFSVKGNKFVGEDYCYTKDTTIKVKDVIYKTGLFISTCSIVYRKKIIENYPDYCYKCSVGDYPLQIMAAMKGKIFYFNSIMSVYRIDNSGSWMGHQKWLSADDSRLRVIHSRVNMLKGFSLDYPKYKKYFNNKIADEISRNMPYSMWDYEGMKKYIKSFDNEISRFSFLWRIDFILRKTRLPLINRYYYKSKYLFKQFQHDRQYY